MTRARSAAAAAATVLAVVLGTTGSTPATAAPEPGGSTERLAQELGLQTVPKQSGTTARKASPGSNPSLSLLSDPSKVDYSYWKAVAKEKSKQRAAAVAKRKAATKAAVEPLLVDEAEPDAVRGGNDSTANAQRIPQFGSAAGKRPAARILGTLAPGATPSTLPTVPEDNGSIPLAGESGLGERRGGDHDRHDRRRAARLRRHRHRRLRLLRDPGRERRAAVPRRHRHRRPATWTRSWSSSTPPATRSRERRLRRPRQPAHRARCRPPATTSSWSAGFLNLPADPFDSGSGDGAGSEGPYSLTLGPQRQRHRLLRGQPPRGRRPLRLGDRRRRRRCRCSTPPAARCSGRRRTPRSSTRAARRSPAAATRSSTTSCGPPACTTSRSPAATGNYDVTLEVYRPGPSREGAGPDDLPRLRRRAAQHGDLRRPGHPDPVAAVGLPRPLGDPRVAGERPDQPDRRDDDGEPEAGLRRSRASR